MNRGGAVALTNGEAVQEEEAAQGEAAQEEEAQEPEPEEPGSEPRPEPELVCGCKPLNHVASITLLLHRAVVCLFLHFYCTEPEEPDTEEPVRNIKLRLDNMKYMRSALII